MKNTLIFLAGLVVGVLCLTAWQEMNTEKSKDNKVVSQASEEVSFEVKYGKSLRVKNIESGESYVLTLTRSEGEMVKYAWTSERDETAGGEGELFEEYDTVARLSEERDAEDVGSSLEIKLSEINLRWSVVSADSGHIHYDPSLLKIAYQKK